LSKSKNNSTSFVLLTCNETKRNSVIKELKSISHISDVIPVQGIYDVLVQINIPHEQIRNMVNTKIRYIDGVNSILTLIDSN